MVPAVMAASCCQVLRDTSSLFGWRAAGRPALPLPPGERAGRRGQEQRRAQR